MSDSASILARMRERAAAALHRRIASRRRAYRAVLLAQDGQPTMDAAVLLADLKRFCHAQTSTFVPGDPHASAFREGRREVWLRIAAHLNMSEADVSRLAEPDYSEGDIYDRYD